MRGGSDIKIGELANTSTGIIYHESISQDHTLGHSGIVVRVDGWRPTEDISGIELLHVTQPIHGITHEDQGLIECRGEVDSLDVDECSSVVAT